MPTKTIKEWQVYTLPPTPSLNVLLRWSTTKWKHRSRITDEITNQVYMQHLIGIQKAGYSKKSLNPARVVLIRQYNEHGKVKALDSDNYAGGCKFAIDALTHAKIIADDSPEHSLFEFYQMKMKQKDPCQTIIMVQQWHDFFDHKKLVAEWVHRAQHSIITQIKSASMAIN